MLHIFRKICDLFVSICDIFYFIKFNSETVPGRRTVVFFLVSTSLHLFLKLLHCKFIIACHGRRTSMFHFIIQVGTFFISYSFDPYSLSLQASSSTCICLNINIEQNQLNYLDLFYTIVFKHHLARACVIIQLIWSNFQLYFKFFFKKN